MITVGGAYQSEPEQARDLILGTVKSHSNILSDPAPNVTFEEFAESALNPVVRASGSSMDNRLTTSHALDSAIHKNLDDAGIEFA